MLSKTIEILSVSVCGRTYPGTDNVKTAVSGSGSNSRHSRPVSTHPLTH